MRELDDETDAAQEGRVDRIAHVGGEDGKATIPLHPLEQVAHLHIGIAIVAVAHLAARAEQRIGLVEQQHGTARLAGVEHGAQPLLGLADIFAHHPAEVDQVEVEIERMGDDFRSQALAGAARSMEQGGDPAPALGPAEKAPIVLDETTVADLRHHVTQRRLAGGGQRDVPPARDGHDAHGEAPGIGGARAALPPDGIRVAPGRGGDGRDRRAVEIEMVDGAVDRRITIRLGQRHTPQRRLLAGRRLTQSDGRRGQAGQCGGLRRGEDDRHLDLAQLRCQRTQLRLVAPAAVDEQQRRR